VGDAEVHREIILEAAFGNRAIEAARVSLNQIKMQATNANFNYRLFLNSSTSQRFAGLPLTKRVQPSCLGSSLIRTNCPARYSAKSLTISSFESPMNGPYETKGSPPAHSCLETASLRNRRPNGLSCVKGDFRAQFLEGWMGVIPSGYSIGMEHTGPFGPA
jgi:hypothetical protein